MKVTPKEDISQSEKDVQSDYLSNSDNGLSFDFDKCCKDAGCTSDQMCNTKSDGTCECSDVTDGFTKSCSPA